MEGGKSDATKAEEGRTRLPQTRPAVRFKLVFSTLLIAVVLLICAVLFVEFS